MKNSKKNSVKELEKFSIIFMQLGLVLVLFIVFISLEHKTTKDLAVVLPPSIEATIYLEPDTEVFFTKEKKLSEPKIIRSRTLIIDEIDKGDNSVDETILDIVSVDTISNNSVFDLNKVIEVKETPEIIENVPFINVQNAPVFKGCEELSIDESKKCFDKKMKQFVQRNFNSDLANQLGLQSGVHKIRTQFIINNLGNIVDVKIRGPHKQLQKEAHRVIKKMPKFIPGMQNNKAVNVRYTLPIAFMVD